MLYLTRLEKIEPNTFLSKLKSESPGPMKNQSTETLKIEATPNPATMIFRLGSKHLTQSYEFLTAQEAEASPLAAKIFGFPWTQSVCLGPDFISVSKQDWVDWDFLAEPLANLIIQHFQADLPLFEISQPAAPSENAILATDSEIVQKIKRILDQEIRPAVAYDGGDVIFSSFEEGRVYLKFKGACQGCPSKNVTLKQGIEVRLKEISPLVIEVLAVS